MIDSALSEASPCAEREELLKLMRQGAIVRAAPGITITHPAGRQLPWTFYGWEVLLTSRGASLAAACVLDALRGFESTQLASHGYAGLPIIAACVAASDGRYTGLAVRHERKSYGLRRLVEGPGDHSRPVVVVDDCLGAGSALRKAIRALEADGYRVEGAISLAHFPWRGATEWAEGLGFKVRTLFDMWEDLQAPTPAVPSRAPLPAPRIAGAIPDGLSPAAAARLVVEQYLQTGTAPAPPGHFDRDYDASGGLFVSARDRRSDARLAREGFMRLDPAEQPANIPAELVGVSVQVADRVRTSPLASDGLGRMKFSVSFAGRFTETRLGDLDADRHGLLVRSRVQPWKRGALLPNHEGWPTEMAQYQQAVSRARLVRNEPSVPERFEVVRVVEADARWRPDGATASSADPSDAGRIGDVLVQRARASLQAVASGRPVPQPGISDTLVAADVTGAAVTLYRRGVVGCGVANGSSLDDCVVRAARNAWTDSRFAPRRQDVRPEEVAVVVSVLHLPRFLGRCTPEQLSSRVRLGSDSLLARDGDRAGFMLAHVPCHYDWSHDQLGRAVLDKGHIQAERCEWWSYRTMAWLHQTPQAAALMLTNGFPARPTEPEPDIEGTIRLLAGYIARQMGEDDLPAYWAFHAQNHQVRDGAAARVVLALNAISEASRFLRSGALRSTALHGLRRCILGLEAHESGHVEVPGLQPSWAADSLLVTAIATARPPWLGRPQVQDLMRRIRRLVHPDGSISALAPGLRMGIDHDGLPGAVLLAIARWNTATGRADLLDHLDSSLAWYRRRFRVQPTWLAMWWQTQAWSALYRLTGCGDYAEFAFELVDWALERQLRKNGAFLVDLCPGGPSFQTACAAEAVADAWAVACLAGDGERADAYAHAWRAAVGFLDTLIMREEDTFFAVRPDIALGGVRQAPTRSAVRIDFVAHALLALVKGAQLATGPGATEPSVAPALERVTG
jgi:orotate phosphoribosyltransferase/AMMECR1 domain-containing protein